MLELLDFEMRNLILDSKHVLDFMPTMIASSSLNAQQILKISYFLFSLRGFRS